MIRSFAALFVALLLAACTAVPKDFALDAASSEGLVLIEVVPFGATNRPSQPYGLQIAPYDATQGFPQGSWISLDQVGGNGGPHYFIGRAKPGEYVISSLDHQALWYSCFNGGTVRFRVEPGVVNYVGRIDPRMALIELALKTPPSSRNHQHHYLLDTPRLNITSADQSPDWRTAAERLVGQNYANVRAEFRPVTLTPATFPTGRSLLGDRVCYGYFRKAEQ